MLLLVVFFCRCYDDDDDCDYVYSAVDQLPHDSEPTASKSGRFHLRPSALDKHAASLFKGECFCVNFICWCSGLVVRTSASN